MQGAGEILGGWRRGERNIGSGEEWKQVTKHWYVPTAVNRLCVGLRSPNEDVLVQFAALRQNGVFVGGFSDQGTLEEFRESLTQMKINRLNNQRAIDIVEPVAGVNYAPGQKTAVPREQRFWRELKDSEKLKQFKKITIVSSQQRVVDAAHNEGFGTILYQNPQQLAQDLAKRK